MPTHRVLIVEDDRGLREVLARGLRGRGFEVLTAADSAGPLQYLSKLRCQLGDVQSQHVIEAARGVGFKLT